MTVPPGDYIIEFVNPSGFVFSPQFAGASTDDSNADPSTGRTPLMTFCSGEKHTDIDVGMNRLSSIGDYVWIDTNADGIQDLGEVGINGVTVTLLDGAGNPILDAMGNTITTMTSGGGAYTFAGLTPGSYSVMFTLPTGYEFTLANAGGDDTLDNDADPVSGKTAPVTIISGEHNPTLDAGVRFNGSLGDQVWIDKNKDGMHDPSEVGQPGVTVQLLDGSGNPVNGPSGSPLVATTDAGGFYAFMNLAPGSYKLMFSQPAGYIFTTKDNGAENIDSDVDPATGMTDIFTLALSEMNPDWDAGLMPDIEISGNAWIDQDGDGVMDSAEAPLPGTTVELMDENCNPILDINGMPITATVDADGNYTFDCLEPGNYTVQFNQPPGFNNTVPGPDNDAPSGKTDPFSVSDDTGGIDSGYQYDNSLGNVVWNDADGDGVQDPEEEGIDGIIVNLKDCNGNPVLDLDGQPISTMTGPGPIGQSGFYEFTNLVPGCYQVEFIDPEGVAVFVPAGQGGDSTTDSDFDPELGCTGDIMMGTSTKRDDIDAGIFGAICGECDRTVLESPVRLSWNGFLQQVNIATVYNTCSVPEQFTISLFDQMGQVQDSVTATLNSRQQMDVILNDMNGFAVDTYGYVEVSFPSTDCINGHVSYYKPDASGDLANSEFTTVLPFVNATTGNSYALFNTVNPSTDPLDAGLWVANWIQITNLNPLSAESFTKNIYDASGALIESETVSVAPFGRVDLQAGHSNPGAGTFGMVEVVPANASSEYSAQLFKYGYTGMNSVAMTTFDFANGAHAKAPEPGCQSVQISSGGNADNWLEIANASSSPLVVDVFINTNGVINASPTQTLTLSSYAQQHIFMNTFVPSGSSGVATVCPQDATRSVLLESMFYFRNDTGSVLSNYAVQGSDGQCVVGYVSYNTFLSQSSFFRAATAGECVVDMNIRAYDQEGNLLGSMLRWITPSGAIDFDLLNGELGILPNTYGLLEVEVTTAGSIMGQSIQVKPNASGYMGMTSANSMN